MDITEKMLVNIKWDSPEVANRVLGDIVRLRQLAEKRVSNPNCVSMFMGLVARKITIEYQDDPSLPSPRH